MYATPPTAAGDRLGPITRTIRHIPQCLLLTAEDEMPETCVATFDSLTVFDPALFDARITRLGEHRLGDFCQALSAPANCQTNACPPPDTVGGDALHD